MGTEIKESEKYLELKRLARSAPATESGEIIRFWHSDARFRLLLAHGSSMGTILGNDRQSLFLPPNGMPWPILEQLPVPSLQRAVCSMNCLGSCEGVPDTGERLRCSMVLTLGLAIRLAKMVKSCLT